MLVFEATYATPPSTELNGSWHLNEEDLQINVIGVPTTKWHPALYLEDPLSIVTMWARGWTDYRKATFCGRTVELDNFGSIRMSYQGILQCDDKATKTAAGTIIYTYKIYFE